MNNELKVFIGIVSEEKTPTTRIVDEIKTVHGVETVFELTGNLDLLVFAKSNSARELNLLIERIRATEGVVSTNTFLVLDEHPPSSNGG